MTEGRMLERGVGRRGFLKTAGTMAVFGGLFTVVGCSDDDKPSTPAPTATVVGGRTLYQRLGEMAAVQAVVTEFVTNVGGDSRINKFFATTDLTKLNRLLVEQVGQATGGPQKYSGRDMKAAHAGLKITMADFNALVEDLVKALDKFNVPMREKNELLAVLGPLNKDIVTA